MGTPHNAAAPGDIAKTVLMPGDPLRARFIAERYLENPVCFNQVRGMLGFTGTYRGKPVSVMGSGMGIPSIGIYSYELFTAYGADNIVRVGSAGSMTKDLRLFDVLLAVDAFSESSYGKAQGGFTGDVTAASAPLCQKLRASAAALGVPLAEGRAHSADVFYRQAPAGGEVPYWQRVHEEKGCVAVEMECFGLFHNARITGKNAACLLTISDSLVSHEETTAAQREKSFTQMMEIALGIL